MTPHSRQRGLSLIEVLIALVVIAIGLLGIAGLQTTAVQSNHLAHQYTLAARLAENLAENMRANRLGLLENAYDLPLGDAPAAPSVNCAAARCTPAQLARWQLADWYASVVEMESAMANTQPHLRGALPRARVGVACTETPCTDRSLRVITLMWDATRSGATGTGCNPASAADLQCFRLVVAP